MKKLIALLIAMCMMASLAACGGSQAAPQGTPADSGAATVSTAFDDTLVVAIWDNNQLAGLQKIADEWSAKSGMKVQINVISWVEYWTLLEAGASGGELPDVFWMHINEAQKYMRADMLIDMNYATIRVGDIVRYIGLTRSYFATIFRKHTGISPQEYLLQCRFKNGVRLLAETDLPIQTIAEQIGYEDPLAFSKAFKKVYEQSPTAYRKQVQDHANDENPTFNDKEVTANGH